MAFSAEWKAANAARQAAKAKTASGGPQKGLTKAEALSQRTIKPTGNAYQDRYLRDKQVNTQVARVNKVGTPAKKAKTAKAMDAYNTHKSNEDRFVKTGGKSGWKTSASSSMLKQKRYNKQRRDIESGNAGKGDKIYSWDSGSVGDRGGGHYDPGTAPQGSWPGAVSRAGDAIKRSRPGSIFRDTVRKGTSQTHIPSRPRR